VQGRENVTSRQTATTGGVASNSNSNNIKISIVPCSCNFRSTDRILNTLNFIQWLTDVKGKKGKGSSLVTVPLTILDSGTFTVSEVAADWHWL